jgi:hypothetical protein
MIYVYILQTFAESLNSNILMSPFFWKGGAFTAGWQTTSECAILMVFVYNRKEKVAM